MGYMEQLSLDPNSIYNSTYLTGWDTTGFIIDSFPGAVRTVDRIEEKDDGVFCVLTDGTLVDITELRYNIVSLRIKELLAELAGTDDVDESVVAQYAFLKELIKFEVDELELAHKRLKFAEGIIRDRADLE